MKICQPPFKAVLAVFLLLSSVSITLSQNMIAQIDGVYLERTQSNCPQTKPDCDPSEKISEPYFEPIAATCMLSEDIIVFDMPGVDDFIQEKNKLLKNVVLKMNDLELPEILTYRESIGNGVLRFRFSVEDLSPEHRKQLFKLPGKSTKKIILGVKFDETNIIYYHEPVTLYLEDIDKAQKLSWVLILAFLVFFVLIIFVYKSLIKDDISNLTDNEAIVACYSFSKTQFAFWTFIVLASYIYIWRIAGDLETLNNTALILLGITSATITTSNLISKKEEKDAKPGKETANLLDFRGKHPDDPKSYFLEDILSDSNGISMHRLQAVVFNLVFGVAFLQAVITDYAMPDFTETQLILLGLSNGTYAFLKSSENKNK